MYPHDPCWHNRVKSNSPYTPFSLQCRTPGGGITHIERIRVHIIYTATSAAIFWVIPIHTAQYVIYTQSNCWLKTLPVKMQLKELIFLFYLNSYSELICRTLWHFLSYRFTFSPFNKHIKDEEYISTVTHKKRGTTSKLINWYLNYVFHLGYIPP